MYNKQGGKCYICKLRPADHVDHNHLKQGRESVRKLLCKECNSGIGLLMDNPELLRAGAAYIEEHNG